MTHSKNQPARSAHSAKQAGKYHILPTDRDPADHCIGFKRKITGGTRQHEPGPIPPEAMPTLEDMDAAKQGHKSK